MKANKLDIPDGHSSVVQWLVTRREIEVRLPAGEAPVLLLFISHQILIWNYFKSTVMSESLRIDFDPVGDFSLS